MPHALDSALDQFRPGFDADGFDITVDSVQGDGTAVVLKSPRSLFGPKRWPTAAT